MTLRKLDARAAMQLLGWKWVDGKLLPPEGKLNNPGEWVDGIPDRLPRFTTDKNSAIGLMERTTKKFEVDGKIDVSMFPDKCTCIMSTKNAKHGVTAKTFAVAMTLLCFKMAGIDIDPEDVEYGDD